jgi:hypothetical protein
VLAGLFGFGLSISSVSPVRRSPLTDNSFLVTFVPREKVHAVGTNS